ncbi:hypothetical protein FHW96_000263 [Novosphingobium sp. SG751A]|uniref:hypothetical protein n=1 Tax=Novosphingobium sp. SG751A TaxID=2587000 RepID=UPI0015568964|nr:hypothetical protein [Novosphingobium sp. SG751A]NOW44136.1 hypothetical protein [Novosphingobium sp. SG751A]
MNAHTHFPAQVPLIATGLVFDHYLRAARQNLENLVRLADGLNDTAFADEARGLLQGFEDSAEGCFDLIDHANCIEAEAA